MRHTGHKWQRGASGATGRMKDVGLKLLGYLKNMQGLSGVGTLTKQTRLPDGSLVKASLFDGQPLVEYFPVDQAEGEASSCSIQMDSGLLDIGPEPRERPFGYTELPEFSDEPEAALYIGDTTEGRWQREVRVVTDTAGGVAGATGTRKENGISQALAPVDFLLPDETLESITSVNKREAQAIMPASCWTGLMRLYVQALYGCPTARYKRVIHRWSPIHPYRPMLRVYDEDGRAWHFDPYQGGGVGLIEVAPYDYRFGRFIGAEFSLFPTWLTKCGTQLRKALASGQIPAAERRKALAFLFTQLRVVQPEDPDEQPVPEWTTTLPDFEVGFIQHYGPRFNSTGLRFANIGWFGDCHFVEYELTYAGASSEVDIVQSEAFNTANFAQVSVLHPDNEVSMGINSDLAGVKLEIDSTNFDLAADFPILCWYKPDDTLEVVRYFKSGGTSISEPAQGSPCADWMGVGGSLRLALWQGTQYETGQSYIYSHQYDVYNFSAGIYSSSFMKSYVGKYLIRHPNAPTSELSRKYVSEIRHTGLTNETIAGTLTGGTTATSEWINSPEKVLMVNAGPADFAAAAAYDAGFAWRGMTLPVSAVDPTKLVNPSVGAGNDYLNQAAEATPSPNSYPAGPGAWGVPDLSDCGERSITDHHKAFITSELCRVWSPCTANYFATSPDAGACPPGDGYPSTGSISWTLGYRKDFHSVSGVVLYTQAYRDEDGGTLLFMVPHGCADAFYCAVGESAYRYYDTWFDNSLSTKRAYQSTWYPPTISGTYSCEFINAPGPDYVCDNTITMSGDAEIACQWGVLATDDITTIGYIDYDDPSFLWLTNGYSAFDYNTGRTSITLSQVGGTHRQAQYERHRSTGVIHLSSVTAPTPAGDPLEGGYSSNPVDPVDQSSITLTTPAWDEADTLGDQADYLYAWQQGFDGLQYQVGQIRFINKQGWQYLVNWNGSGGRFIPAYVSHGGDTGYFSNTYPFRWDGSDITWGGGYVPANYYNSFVGWA